jgi:hypothetical protein
MPASYLSPKTRVGKSAIEGRGLFARRRIRKGEIVAIKGGHVYDARTLAKVKGVSRLVHPDRHSFFHRSLRRRRGGAEQDLHQPLPAHPTSAFAGRSCTSLLRDIGAGES